MLIRNNALRDLYENKEYDVSIHDIKSLPANENNTSIGTAL